MSGSNQDRLVELELREKETSVKQREQDAIRGEGNDRHVHFCDRIEQARRNLEVMWKVGANIPSFDKEPWKEGQELFKKAFLVNMKILVETDQIAKELAKG